MKNQTLILLGATGNLAKLKIYPALKFLKENCYVDSSFKLIGVAYEDKTTEEYREFVASATDNQINDAEYVTMDFEKEDFHKLAERIPKDGDVTFYLAINPKHFLTILRNIKKCGYLDNRKIILEKPYGLNYQNTVEINGFIDDSFEKNQVYRIDHYLAKEGLEELAQAKKTYSEQWNSNYIKSLSFVFTETNGIEERLDFYRETGAVVDFMQNHILQLILKTIDEPVEVVLESMKNGDSYFHGKQYLDFQRETLVYGSISLNSAKWKNLKVNLLTGKKMKEKKSQIIIDFKTNNNPLVIDFTKKSNTMPEYARLILDCMEGNSEKFVSGKMAEATWEFGDLIRTWWKDQEDIEKYKEDTLTSKDILNWIELEG